MKFYRFKRVLRTLGDNFTSFKPAFQEVVFQWAQEESSKLQIQSLPSNIRLEDITDFEYEQLYAEIKEQAPILHAAVKGGMASHYSYDEV